MPLTLKYLGLEAYLEQLYGEGTYKRFLKLTDIANAPMEPSTKLGPDAWPKMAICKDLGFSAPSLNSYILKYKEEHPI